MKKIIPLFIAVLLIGTLAYAESDSEKRGLGIFRAQNDRDKAEERTSTAPTRAVAEIDRRIESLTKLQIRVQAMVRVSDATKASLKATIDEQIDLLTDLKTTIQNTTDEAALKAAIASITKSYRVYMLVMPQIQMLAASDRITTTADLMTTLNGKLDTRIAEAKTAGKDVGTLEAASADMKTQIAEAKANASAVITLTTNLKPDNGDKALMESNKKALTDARAKIKAAHEDLKQARKDAETIVKGLKGFGVNAKADIKKEDR